MKQNFDASLLPKASVLFTCSSHEKRCLAIPMLWANWRPQRVILFHYDDVNLRREKNHAELLRLYGAGSDTVEVIFTERDAVESFRRNRSTLQAVLSEIQLGNLSIVFDISVFTKRHLLMLLRWFDDEGLWSRLFVLYSEPESYFVTEHIPLSFGVAKVEEVPGFSAMPDVSRPLHVVMILGFEGDRTLATYEILQPMQTTLVISDPPFREEWRGRSEELNNDLISLVGPNSIRRVDAVDPEATRMILREVLGPEEERGTFSKIVCPLGTKPQTLGTYLYTRKAIDPPAVVYTGPLRHNHAYFSRGVGYSWIVMRPS